MALTPLLGTVAKVDINWRPVQTPTVFVPFRVIAGSILDEAELEETTDTDTQYGGREYISDGYCVAQINLSIQIDFQLPYPSTWLYVTPYTLIPGYLIGLRIWPEGRSGPRNSQWIFTYAMVKSVSTGFGVRGSQPYGGQISLVSYGKYKRPYESLSQAPIPIAPASEPFIQQTVYNTASPGNDGNDPNLNP